VQGRQRNLQTSVMYMQGVAAYAPPFKVPDQLNYSVHLTSLISSLT